MKKQPMNFVLAIMFCTAFLSCEAMATLFHGPKPESPPVIYTVTFDTNGASGTEPAAQSVNADTLRYTLSGTVLFNTQLPIMPTVLRAQRRRRKR